jgi:hypothetical protein
MEDVLDVYQRPYDPKRPQLCLDEASKQLLGEVREPIPLQPGKPEREDYEYKRHGTANLFMVSEPLQGQQQVTITDQCTRVDFAHVIKEVVDVHYPESEIIVLVMDNLNTHDPASLYEAFEPAEANRLADKLEIHHTPKHGSWLNMAEIELSIMGRQCLAQRIPDKGMLTAEAAAWEERRNRHSIRVDWRFTTADTCIKLKRLYASMLP